VVIAGHAFLQNLRRGHYELGVDARHGLRIAAAFTETRSSDLTPRWAGRACPQISQHHRATPSITDPRHTVLRSDSAAW
jgi:hypothetical protein